MSDNTTAVRIERAEQLDELPEGTAYVSDGYSYVREVKRGSVWYAEGSDQQFEPALPGTAYVSE